MTKTTNHAYAKPTSFNMLNASEEELNEYIKQLKGDVESDKQTEETPKQEGDNQDTAERKYPDAEKVEPTPEKVTSPTDNSDTVDWKKRYTDLQSHSDKRYNEVMAKLQEVTEQLTEKDAQLATVQSTPQLPLSDEEFEELAKDYPSIDNMIQVRAHKLLEQYKKEFSSEIATLKAELGQSKEEKAKEQLRKMHPDFDTLDKDPQFIDWFKTQPKGVQALIQSSNVLEIARGLDLYKKEMGIKSEKEKQLEATIAVDTKTSKNSEPSTPQKMKISEIKKKITSLRGNHKKLDAFMQEYNKAVEEGRVDFNS